MVLRSDHTQLPLSAESPKLGDPDEVTLSTLCEVCTASIAGPRRVCVPPHRSQAPLAFEGCPPKPAPVSNVSRADIRSVRRTIYLQGKISQLSSYWATNRESFMVPWTWREDMAKEDLSQDGGRARGVWWAPRGVRRWKGVIPNPKAKLLDQVREVMRLKHYSLRTERSYGDWITPRQPPLARTRSSGTVRASAPPLPRSFLCACGNRAPGRDPVCRRRSTWPPGERSRGH